MIPVQLTIQGLYSYQQKQTIDFTKLTNANLFGIFGSVGSGKSSILEAITFALYGKTDRLNLSGDNRNYNMMNLKSDELLIDFVFETGKSQVAYRAVVHGKRNSKRFEDVKKLDRTAYQRIDNQWVPIEPSALEAAIGLSYANFKRTIIIPQGQFQEFLQLGNKDRTQMMKELFNLEKFEFYYKVVALENKNNAQKQTIEGQLQQLGTVDPEQVAVYDKQLKILSDELKKQDEKLSGLQKKEEALRKLQLLTQKKAEAEKQWKALQKQEPEFALLEKKVKRYELCVSGFKYFMEALREHEKTREDLKKQITGSTEKLAQEKKAIAEAETAMEQLKPAYDKRDELKTKADELTRLLRIKALESSIETETLRVKKGTEICETTLQQVKTLRTEKERLGETIKTKRKAIPDFSLLSTIRTWYIDKRNLETQLKDILQEENKRLKEDNEIREKRAELLADPLFHKLPEGASYAECIQHVKSETDAVKRQQKQLMDQKTHLNVKQQLEVYSRQLEDGQPCPLCGALHHPDTFKAEDLQVALTKINKQNEQYEQQLEKMANFVNRLSLLDNQHQTLRRNLKETAAQKHRQQEKIKAHSQQFAWPQYDEESKLLQAENAAKALQSDLKKLDKKLEELALELTKKENEKDRFQAEVEKIKRTLTANETELKTLIAQLQFIRPEHYSETPKEKIENEKAALLQELKRVENEFNVKSTFLQAANQRKDVLSGSLQSLDKQLAQEEITLTKLREELAAKLANSPFESTAEISRILAEPLNLEAEKQRLSDFKQQLQNSQSLLVQLQQEMGEAVYSPDEHRQLTAAIQALKVEISQKNQEQGKVAELLKKLLADLKNQKDLRAALEKLELRAANIKTMKSLFKASGFVNYISSVYLQNLCNAANHRFFQLTRQKLSLEITPDNNFQVRDFMNGGKVRNVKTLSGGQTFQAALSLALALADNVQKITASNQNFFFLDEGFGALDKEALNIVFDTLKTLRKENRIVGVISHVEEMQQEIDVHLRIDNSDEQGSIIRPSWKN